MMTSKENSWKEVYLLILSVAFSMASSTMYYYKKSIDDLFVADKLTKVVMMDDIWKVCRFFA